MHHFMLPGRGLPELAALPEISARAAAPHSWEQLRAESAPEVLAAVRHSSKPQKILGLDRQLRLPQVHQITDTNSRNSINAHHEMMRLLPLCCAAVAARKAQDRWCPPPKLPPRSNQNISIITEFHSKVTPSDNFNLRAHNTGGVKTMGFRYTATALARFAYWHLVVA